MTSEIGGQRNGTKGIQLTACLRILTFFSFKARNGNCHFICNTYLCYQGFHNLQLSELTCEHVKYDISACQWPFQRKLFLLKQRKKKPHTFEISFWAKVSYWILILNIQSGFISKKFSDIGHNFFSCKNTSRKNLLVYEGAFMCVLESVSQKELGITSL